MTPSDVPLIIVSSLLALSIGTVIYLFGRVVVSKRNLTLKSREIHREREATADILRISGAAMRTESVDADETTFLSFFVEYVARAVQGTGAAVFNVDENENLVGVGVAGVFPPLKEVTIQVEQKLLGNCKFHTDFIKAIDPIMTVAALKNELDGKPYRLYIETSPSWAPPRLKNLAPKLLVAPILRHKKVEGCVMVVSRNEFDEHSISDLDGQHLVRLNELASLSVDAIKIFRRRQRYEEELQVAREEGMLQVSTGIIHNIGNAVTVAKLAVHELIEKHGADDDRPDKLIREMILPQIRSHVSKGDAQDFLQKDKVGSQYLDILEELLQAISKADSEAVDTVKGLNEKLRHISDIVELQQRFMGELGTENLLKLSEPLLSAIKIYKETCDKRGIQMDVDINEHSTSVLVDSSLMAQVFVNIMKNAAEAMDTAKDTPPKLSIQLKELPADLPGKSTIVVTIADNGPGISDDILPRIFDFGFSTKTSASRGFGLHSCKKTVEKYGGEIHVDTALLKGTTFSIYLPAKKEEER